MTGKRILLAAAAVGLAVAAYFTPTRADRTPAPRIDPASTTNIHRFIARPTSQPGSTTTEQGIKLSPGENTRARVYDDVTGRLKYQFEAEKWEPITESRFHLVKIDIQIYTPRGQITYIRADQAEVDLGRHDRKGVVHSLDLD